MLALGLSLSSKHLDSDQLDTFMKRMLVSRISRRVLAEHHISLSTAHHRGSFSPSNQVGIIDTDLSVKDSIDRCLEILKEAGESEIGNLQSGVASFPRIEIDGHIETRFSYIKASARFSDTISGSLLTRSHKEHLDYVVLELLNNVIADQPRKNHYVTYIIPLNDRQSVLRGSSQP
jgi:pyruvate dehydrogenase kinase 2/3/4